MILDFTNDQLWELRISLSDSRIKWADLYNQQIQNKEYSKARGSKLVLSRLDTLYDRIQEVTE